MNPVLTSCLPLLSISVFEVLSVIVVFGLVGRFLSIAHRAAVLFVGMCRACNKQETLQDKYSALEDQVHLHGLDCAGAF